MQELGGWRLHSQVTGQADRIAEDEDDCFEIVKESYDTPGVLVGKAAEERRTFNPTPRLTIGF